MTQTLNRELRNPEPEQTLKIAKIRKKNK